jgi:hypothetical protein
MEISNGEFQGSNGGTGFSNYRIVKPGQPGMPNPELEGKWQVTAVSGTYFFLF